MVLVTMVMDVNLLFSCRLNDRQFCQLLLQAENQYGDLFYFFSVRWLGRHDMLQRVYTLSEEIATFLKLKTSMLQNFATKTGFLI